MKSRLFVSQVSRLASGRCPPFVRVGRSKIKGAGNGVFVAKSEIPRNTAVLLYPGEYTPGLPKYLNVLDGEPLGVYLADGRQLDGDDRSSFEENAYILNLPEYGGFLDGANIGGEGDDDLQYSNPSVCGHLVNHSATMSNVRVVSFLWKDILDEKNQPIRPLNRPRCDGSPWFVDIEKGQVVHFPNKPSYGSNLLCGATMVSTRRIAQDEEILLDYGLKSPLPAWAEGWYE